VKRRRLGWALWLIAVLSLYFFENNTATRIVFVASILVPVFSALCAVWCVDHIYFEISIPEKVRTGEDFLCSLRVSGSFLLAGCIPFAKISAANLLTGEVIESRTVQIDRSAVVKMNSAYCGSLIIHLKEAAVEDRFGLFRFPLQNTPGIGSKVVIYPELTPVKIIHEGQTAVDGVDGNGSQGQDWSDPSSYNGIREYVPGDPVRQIHWKLSAKTDRLLLREMEKDQAGAVELRLESDLPDVLPQFADKAVCALLSLSRSLAMKNYRHTVSWYDDRRGIEHQEVGSYAAFLQMQDSMLMLKSKTAAAVMDGNGANAEIPEQNAPVSHELWAGPDDLGRRVILFSPCLPAEIRDEEPVFEI